MFDIADVPFSCVDSEEKVLYTAKIRETVHDQLEHYSINRDVTKRQHPEGLRPFLSEIEAFARHTHFNVLHPVLRLLARGLELPEDALVDLHRFSSAGETYSKCYPRSEAEELKTKNVWLKGHTDMGSITVLYSQPISALQILGQDGKWKWIKHIENAAVINAGDVMEFLSGGYYKATIHSPVLQRIGIVRACDDADAPTMEAWRRARTSAYGRSQLKASDAGNVEEEVINGVVVKHYS
ncbi:hypothetical protein K438DRAFT_1908006 [Mycena galopus ATCC 62051]|nr:hypothetical protein K438DRAFT_1908006 [Mycena galopus ATCC 62051]